MNTDGTKKLVDLRGIKIDIRPAQEAFEKISKQLDEILDRLKALEEQQDAEWRYF